MKKEKRNAFVVSSLYLDVHFDTMEKSDNFLYFKVGDRIVSIIFLTNYMLQFQFYKNGVKFYDLVKKEGK